MSEVEDTPRHWVRDLLIGAAVVLAVVQTVRISATEDEIVRLKAELAEARMLHVQAKDGKPLVELVSVEEKSGELIVRLKPLRDANVTITVRDAAGKPIAACGRVGVPLPPEVRCPAPGAGNVLVEVAED